MSSTTVSILRGALVALFVGTLAACGGGGGDNGGSTPPPTTTPTTVKDRISAAAAVQANDTATNASAPFTTLQEAGVPTVTIANGRPQVNFSVFSGGRVLTGLTTTAMSFAIAKLVPGANGEPDRWLNYVYRTETAAAGVGPNGQPVLPRATQATTDPKTPAQLTFNENGYYTYTFATDIRDLTKTNGVAFDPNQTHRVAIQLAYKDAATGEDVRVNPYIDFKFDANGNAVIVTDPSQTRKMADVSSCNSCHEKLALHGGGRVDVQYCVMCHNPATTDANSGNVLNMATMVHKIHSGRLLNSQLHAGQGGERYAIWGYGNSLHDYSETGFPQDLRNCTKCHTGANPATPQGDNWKTQVSKEACLTCHANKPGSDWHASHTIFAGTLVGAGAAATDLTNQQCKDCHRVGSNISPERVHFNQNEEHGARYKMNIESVTFNDTPDHKGRSVTVRYFLSDPTNGNAAYSLVTPDCTGAGATLTCPNTSRFGNLRLYVAYQSLVGQPTGVTEFTSYNNGGNTATAFAYKGTNDGNNHYTVAIPIPDDTATHVVQGTARAISIGQVKEPLLEVKSATDPRPAAVPASQVNVVVQNTSAEFAITGPLNPRRQIVSNEKCNVCHGALGTTSGSNTLANAFHGGARNTVEACVLCHDPNRMSSTVMTNGLQMNESYHFKRMIHGIHGNSRRVSPFTHGNKVYGNFNKAGVLLTQGIAAAELTRVSDGSKVPAGTAIPAGTLLGDFTGVENYAAEVFWPGVGINCNACHVDNSYKVDRGPVGSVVGKPAGVTDPLQWLVITPKAATCTACHDSPQAIGHVTSFGNAGFGNLTQAQSFNTVEICADCHASGGFKGVDIVHGQP